MTLRQAREKALFDYAETNDRTINASQMLGSVLMCCDSTTVKLLCEMFELQDKVNELKETK